ncbi:uncharacterized protein DS421_4g125740 [Arachis hypogaea]|nr:uncharacterized protein DS421_4g125740 [Arachis hypogaea]
MLVVKVSSPTLVTNVDKANGSNVGGQSWPPTLQAKRQTLHTNVFDNFKRNALEKLAAMRMCGRRVRMTGRTLVHQRWCPTAVPTPRNRFKGNVSATTNGGANANANLNLNGTHASV